MKKMADVESAENECLNLENPENKAISGTRYDNALNAEERETSTNIRFITTAGNTLRVSSINVFGRIRSFSNTLYTEIRQNNKIKTILLGFFFFVFGIFIIAYVASIKNDINAIIKNDKSTGILENTWNNTEISDDQTINTRIVPLNDAHTTNTVAVTNDFNIFKTNRPDYESTISNLYDHNTVTTTPTTNHHGNQEEIVNINVQGSEDLLEYNSEDNY
ncbi:hypothetical protein EDEG_01302 [Edhazardia aedis USNM 41457]|uniref:Uncharacterized protein n=1 Tax=Edhazardia aedis (strain USNM 41457) TaxID=1003232 RepID=J9DPK2_EDHAE|nr:hypothetical protein EDEG_01302 [Edhazardia aedis USNM 41457]|eukprot:EJW04485.1 hypothetical protein EDEG_01302 [Edhazardia aedis USNM 41457]